MPRPRTAERWWYVPQGSVETPACLALFTNHLDDNYIQLLTGSTGAVGCHILHALVQRPTVQKVYCLIRTKKSASASERLDHVLATNHLLEVMTAEQHQKIIAVDYDLYNADGTLGLSANDYEILRTSVTAICHNAWAVNFNMNLSDFEPHCRGTYDLINLALQSPRKTKPTFLFVSTVGAVMRASPNPIKETLYDFEAASGGVNYAVSKWITERVCHQASQTTHLEVHIVRLGQICGDTKHGMWNIKEAWPMLIASGRTIGCLPANATSDREQRWLPSDVTGAAIADIVLLDQVNDETRASVGSFMVFHIANNQSAAWKASILPALKRHGLQFETVSWPEWAARLDNSDSNVLRNPPYRLRHFFHSLASMNDDNAGAPRRLFLLDMTNACKISPRLAHGASVDDDLIGKFLKYWETQPGWTGQSYPAKM